MSVDTSTPRSVHLPSLLADALEATRKAVRSSHAWQDADHAARLGNAGGDPETLPDLEAVQLPALLASDPIGDLAAFMQQRGFSFGHELEFDRNHPEESRVLSGVTDCAEQGLKMAVVISNGGEPSWEWLDELELLFGELPTLLARAVVVAPTPSVEPPPLPIGAGPLAAYYAELWAAEEAFLAGRSPGVYSSGHSFWHRPEGLDQLCQIDERHGVEFETDPRVYSIAAFKTEETAFLRERDRRHKERKKAIEEGRAYRDEPYGRSIQYATDYKARHFPGFDWRHPEETIDSEPKLWIFIRESISTIKTLRGMPFAPNASRSAATERLAVAYSMLHELEIAWAFTPGEYLKDPTERQCRDALRNIANRLDREESDRLPDDALAIIREKWGRNSVATVITPDPKPVEVPLAKGPPPLVPLAVDQRYSRAEETSDETGTNLPPTSVPRVGDSRSSVVPSKPTPGKKRDGGQSRKVLEYLMVASQQYMELVKQNDKPHPLGSRKAIAKQLKVSASTVTRESRRWLKANGRCIPAGLISGWKGKDGKIEATWEE